MQKNQEPQKIDKREEFQYGIAFLTNPAIQSSDKPEDTFFCMIDTKLDKREPKKRWVPVSNPDHLIQPYYAGIARVITKIKYPTFIVTGGVYYDGSTQESSTTFQTYPFCYKMELVEENDTLRLKILSSRPGKARVEMVDGKEQDIQENEDLIPQMITPRHNHTLFAVPKNELEFIYYAIGGQQLYLQEEEGKVSYVRVIHESGEKLDEKTKKWDEIEPMKQARAGFSGFVSKGKIYVFGGFGKDEKFLQPNDSEYYDTQTDKWYELKMRWKLGIQPNLLGACCLPLSETKILILGGTNGKSGPSNQICLIDLDLVDQKNPLLQPKLLTDKVKLQEPRTKLQVMIVQKGSNPQLIISGGGVDSFTVESFLIEGTQNDFKLIPEGKPIDILPSLASDVTEGYKFSNLQGSMAWAYSSLALPNLIYSDYEKQKLF